ncbi:hypothetical protein AB1N83_013509 [Pleurotus pulmonarius]
MTRLVRHSPARYAYAGPSLSSALLDDDKQDDREAGVDVRIGRGTRMEVGGERAVCSPVMLEFARAREMDRGRVYLPHRRPGQRRRKSASSERTGITTTYSPVEQELRPNRGIKRVGQRHEHVRGSYGASRGRITVFPGRADAATSTRRVTHEGLRPSTASTIVFASVDLSFLFCFLISHSCSRTRYQVPVMSHDGLVHESKTWWLTLTLGDVRQQCRLLVRLWRQPFSSYRAGYRAK